MNAESRDFAAIDAWLQPWQQRRLSIQNRLKELLSAPPPAKFAAQPAVSAPVLRRSEHVAQLAEPPPAASAAPAAAPAFEGVGERAVTTRSGFLTRCTSHQDQSRHVTEAAEAAAAAVMRAATVASSAAAKEDAVAAGDDAASAVEAAAVDAAVMEVAAALDAAGYWPDIGTVGAHGFHEQRGEDPAPVPAAARYYTTGAALARSGSSHGPSYAVRHLPQHDPASTTSREHDYAWPDFNGITTSIDNWEERSRNVGWLAAQNEAAEIAAKQRLGLLPSAPQPPLQPQPALPSRLTNLEDRARGADEPRGPSMRG